MNSEAQRRLAWLMEQRPDFARKIGRIQVTMLDPHPANGRAGFWTNSPLYEKAIRLFEDRAMDPDPVVWNNTTLVDVYIQKCEIAPSDKPFLNPFGMQLDRAGVDNLIDLTGREFVRRGQDGIDAKVLVSHTELGAWYTQTIRDNCAECEVDGVVVGGGFYDSLLGRHSEARDNSHDAVRISTTRDTSRGVPPIEADSVFNGDFRFDGRVDKGTFKMFEEKHRIPGWFGNRRPEVTAEGRLRLATSGRKEPGPDTVTVTHNPFFISPQSTAIQFDVINRASAATDGHLATLAVYFAPARVDNFGNLIVDSDREHWIRLGSWMLRAMADDDPSVLPPDVELSLTLPIHPAVVGTLGTLCFEAQTPHASENATDLVEIDNVRLVPLSSGNNPVAATTELQERR